MMTSILINAPNGCCFARQVEKLVKGMPVNLIEHLGQRIADELISTHRLIKGVEIQIRKPHVAIPGMQASSVGEMISFAS